MRNYPNQNKHFYPSYKSNRYPRNYKQPLNIDDYLNGNPSYSNKQGQDWDDNYNYTYQEGNATSRGYYNKNYYNGQTQRYNHYPKYDKEDSYTPKSTSSSNYNDNNLQSFPKSFNNYNDDRDIYSRRPFPNASGNSHMPNQKYQSRQQKTLKVAKSLTDLSEAKNSNTSEFNLKRNFPSKEEILRVKINLKNEVKDIIVYKNDDCLQIAKNFVEQNNLSKSLIHPISLKLTLAIEKITNLLMEKLSNEEVEMLDSIKTLSNKNSYHTESYEETNEQDRG